MYNIVYGRYNKFTSNNINSNYNILFNTLKKEIMMIYKLDYQIQNLPTDIIDNIKDFIIFKPQTKG